MTTVVEYVEKAVRAAAHDRGNEMPRRSKVERRVPAPDARFNSEVLARFINKVMERGKKGTAERIVYGALDRIAERTGRNPLEVF